MRFLLLLAALAAAACSPAYTSDTSESATSLTFDVNVTTQPVDGQCMPNVLTPSTDGTVSCAALVVAPGVDQSVACTLAGTSQPDAATLAHFATTWRETHPSDPIPAACAYEQLAGGSCSSSSEGGWCYVQNSSRGCASDIEYGGGGLPEGTRVHFDCLF